MGLLAVAVARGWSPGARSGALHCFGRELPLLASMFFVESLIPMGASNPRSRWASFGLDLRPPAGAAAALAALAAAALAAAALALAVADVAVAVAFCCCC